MKKQEGGVTTVTMDMLYNSYSLVLILALQASQRQSQTAAVEDDASDHESRTRKRSKREEATEIKQLLETQVDTCCYPDDCG